MIKRLILNHIFRLTEPYTDCQMCEQVVVGLIRTDRWSAIEKSRVTNGDLL